MYLKGQTDGLVASLVQLRRTSDQTIATGTPTLVTFQAESIDVGGWWSSGTNVIVPVAAIPPGYTTIYVDVNVRLRWATNGTGNRRARPLLNGTLFGSTTQGGISGDPTEQSVIETVEVAALDVITLEVYQTSGGNLALEVGNMTVKIYRPAS